MLVVDYRIDPIALLVFLRGRFGSHWSLPVSTLLLYVCRLAGGPMQSKQRDVKRMKPGLQLQQHQQTPSEEMFELWFV